MTARAALARARGFARGAWDRFPLNASGVAVLCLAGLAGWFYGVGKLDLILLTAAFCAAVLTVALGLVTPLGAWRVHRRLRRAEVAPPSTLLCGEWRETGLRLRAPWWLPFLVAEVAWETPPKVAVSLEGSSGREVVYPRRRGVYSEVVRRVSVGDVLGLTAIRWTVRTPAALTFEPAPAPLERPADLLGLVGGEDLPDPLGAPRGDRVDVRRYGPGDSPRLILWKVYARTRRLFVRTHERALEAAPRTCAYLVADPGDEPAATLARTVLERGLMGEGWRFGADGAKDAERLPEALHSLALSGTLPAPPCGLAPFLQRAAKEGFGACLLLLPPAPGPWLAEAAAALASTPLRVTAVAAFRGWEGAVEARPWWRRLLLRPAPPRGARAADLEALVRALSGPTVRFSLVDTDTGAILKDPEGFLAKAAGGRAA